MLRGFEAAWVLVGDPDMAPIRDGAVVVAEDGSIVAVGNATELRALHPSAAWSVHRGVMMPGLVNAYVRLEHTLVESRISGGRGFVPFFAELSSKFSPWTALDMDDAPIARAIEALDKFGTAAIGEVTASGAALGRVVRAPFASAIFLEVAGMSEDAARVVETFARELYDELPDAAKAKASIVPHSLLGTHRASVRRLAAEAHEDARLFAFPLATSAAERTYLERQTGDFADFLRERKLDGSAEPPLGMSSVHAAVDLGALGVNTLAVQLLDASREEIALVASARASVVVMPRAALHIEVRLPDVPAMIAAGLTPALGTDSVVASGDVDVLAEARTLRARFRSVPSRTWIAMATHYGAQALRKEQLGSLAVGKAPGLLLIDGDAGDDPESWLLADGVRIRRWLVRPKA